jgi:hypothetical protein
MPWDRINPDEKLIWRGLNSDQPGATNTRIYQHEILMPKDSGISRVLAPRSSNDYDRLKRKLQYLKNYYFCIEFTFV